MVAGCTSSGSQHVERAGDPTGEIAIMIPEGQYAAAFDAAVAEARRLGLEPQLLDRRAGLIEAGPARSASVLEPWAGTTSPGENTLHQQRRVLRVAFEPQGISPAAQPDQDPLMGPITDLTALSSPLRMVVTVSVQRQQKPIDHRATWSLATRSEAWQFDSDTGEPRQAIWRTIRRDAALESRFAARCEARLLDA